MSLAPVNGPDVGSGCAPTAEDDEAPAVTVHERQSLQLCALHATNNLLQLEFPPHFGKNACREVPAATSTRWVCHGRVVMDGSDRDKTRAATKEEFDGIADGLTAAEDRLMRSDPTARGGASGVESSSFESSGPSLLQKLRSNHRTPYFGNYSFEVMETALRQRGVDLEWYRLQDVDGDGVNIHTADVAESSSLHHDRHASRGSNAPPESNSQREVEGSSEGKKNPKRRVVIGFILNSEEGSEGRSWWSSARQYARKAPLLGRYFGDGRHWYAITGIRRMVGPCLGIERLGGENGASGLQCSNKSSSDVEGGWTVLDSERDDVIDLKTDNDLAAYMWGVQDRLGGNIFRATMLIDNSAKG